MNENIDRVAIAISKGRIAKSVQPLLETAGIAPIEDLEKSRKLVFETQMPNVDLIIVRSTDVPTYVQLGGADFGIVGKDVLLEVETGDYYELVDLGVCRCELVVAGISSSPGGMDQSGRKRRVATKYVNTARRHFASRGEYVDVMRLTGSMELAPLRGLSDRIVDLFQTGSTLRSNGLEKHETIAKISARLIANRASMRLERKINETDRAGTGKSGAGEYRCSLTCANCQRATGISRTSSAACCPRASEFNPQIDETVRGIIEQVRTRGDDALVELTGRYDHYPVLQAADLEISKDQMMEAQKRIAPQLLDSIKLAAQRIRAFHGKTD